MSNIAGAKKQLTGLDAALNARSQDLQVLGNVGIDDHPEVLLAVGVKHVGNALELALKEIALLRDEVDALSKKARYAR